MYYVQKHSGRKLTWLHHMSLGEWLGEKEREGREGGRRRREEEREEDTYSIMSLACLLR